MHEDFLSYIMIGLSRGLFPVQTQKTRVPTEDDVLRERLREMKAAKNRAAPAPERAERKATGLWRRTLKSGETELKRVAEPGHPLICGS